MLALQPEMPSSQGIDCGRQQPRARKGRDKVGAPQVLQLRELGRRTITVALDRIHCRRTPRRFFGTTRRVSGPSESGNGGCDLAMM